MAMRVIGSSLVSAGEIPVYLHQPVNWIKPPKLTLRVPDDHWASLKLRVDPLVRKILDPTRSLLVAACLIFLFWQVFRTIKPDPTALLNEYCKNVTTTDYSYGFDMDMNDDYNDVRLLATNNYYQQDLQDLLANSCDQQDQQQDQQQQGEEHQQKLQYYIQYQKQKEYDIYLLRTTQMEHSLVYWNTGFFTFVFLLMLVTAYLSKGMMDNNACVDELIKTCLKEIRQRFQLECGLDISYRTNQRDTRRCWYSLLTDGNRSSNTTNNSAPILSSHTNTRNAVLINTFLNIVIVRPIRVIVFTDLIGDESAKSLMKTSSTEEANAFMLLHDDNVVKESITTITTRRSYNLLTNAGNGIHSPNDNNDYKPPSPFVPVNSVSSSSTSSSSSQSARGLFS